MIIAGGNDRMERLSGSVGTHPGNPDLTRKRKRDESESGKAKAGRVRKAKASESGTSERKRDGSVIGNMGKQKSRLT
jgi:hypothetical protein